MERLDVAYVLLRFPFLTETFVADEIWQLREQNNRVRVCSLLKPRERPANEHSEQLARETIYAPEWYSGRLWLAQLFLLFRSPRMYLGLVKEMLALPRPGRSVRTLLQRGLIFFKAVALAGQLRGTGLKSVHAHFAWLSGAGALVIGRLLDVPFTVTVHAYDLYASNDLLEWVVRSAARVIAISEYNKQQILQACPGIDPDSIVVVHCGIAVDQFAPVPRSRIPGEPLRLLSVGSLIEKKGHNVLIRACSLLQARGLDFRCTIIGRGPQKPVLEELVRAEGLQDRVLFAGARGRDQVLEAYRSSDLFVLACQVAPGGDRDGIPVVLMEAMATQVPVISTCVSGIPELVQPGATGWLVPEGDAQALAETVLRAHESQALSEQWAHNGRTLVEQEFNIQANVKRLEHVLECATR